MSNSAMAGEENACETDHFSVNITVNDVPIPIFSGGEDTSYYVESNLSTPVSYKVQTEELVKDEKEIQSWPVTPYQILIRRFSEPEGPCYFDIKIDGVKVKSCTVEPNTVRKISGFKDKGQVREFLFSLPRLAKAVTDKLEDESRQSKVGMIEIECYEADYVTDSIHDRKKLNYQQASKNDVRAVTGGQYTMSTTKVGRVLYTKDATRRVHVWRKIRLLSKIVIRYRMGHTLREMGLEVPEYPKIPLTFSKGKMPRRPLIIRHNLRVGRDRDRSTPDGSDNENEDPEHEPVTVKRENSPIMIDLTNDDSNSKTFDDDDDSDVEFLGAKRIKTETVDLTEEGIIGDSAMNVEESESPKPSTSGLQIGRRVENIGRNQENLSESEDDEDDDDGNEMVVVYEKKKRRKQTQNQELNLDLTGSDQDNVVEGANSKVTEMEADIGVDAAQEAESASGEVTDQDVFDLLDLDFDPGESRNEGFGELFGESVLAKKKSESPSKSTENAANDVTESGADDVNEDTDDVTEVGELLADLGSKDDRRSESNENDDLPTSTGDVMKTTDHQPGIPNEGENPTVDVTEPADDVMEPPAEATPFGEDPSGEHVSNAEGDDVTMEGDDVIKASEDLEMTNVEDDDVSDVDEDKLVVAERMEEEKKTTELNENQTTQQAALEVGTEVDDIENDSGCSAIASGENEVVARETDASADESVKAGLAATPNVTMGTIAKEVIADSSDDAVAGDVSNEIVESAPCVAMETGAPAAEEVVAGSNNDAVARDVPNEDVESSSSVAMETAATVAKEVIADSNDDAVAGDAFNIVESALSVSMETGTAVAKEVVAGSIDEVVAGDVFDGVVESALSVAKETGDTVAKEAVVGGNNDSVAGDVSKEALESASSLTMETEATVAKAVVSGSNDDAVAEDVSKEAVESAPSVTMETGITVAKAVVAISNEDVAEGDVSNEEALELLLDTSTDDVAEKSEFSDATEDKLLE